MIWAMSMSAHTLSSEVSRTVSILGFEGIGILGVRPELRNEHPLIAFGQFGVSLDRGRTIFGFSPSDVAIRQLIQQEGVDGFRALLLRGSAILGQVQNDTSIFRRAHVLFREGLGETQVWELPYEVSQSQFHRIESQIRQQIESGPNPSWYALPTTRIIEGSMPVQCNNCATWPRTLNLNIPENTGVLEIYMAELRNSGIP
jgi:hypothetical protein